MNEKENLIAKITDEASKEAEKQKLNKAQTKLYVDSKVQKAVADYESKNTNLKMENSNDVESKTEKKIKEKSKTAKQVKEYIVHTPVENFCGIVAGVHFAYGKAEVKSGWVLNWFKERGYKVEEISK